MSSTFTTLNSRSLQLTAVEVEKDEEGRRGGGGGGGGRGGGKEERGEEGRANGGEKSDQTGRSSHTLISAHT